MIRFLKTMNSRKYRQFVHLFLKKNLQLKQLKTSRRKHAHLNRKRKMDQELKSMFAKIFAKIFVNRNIIRFVLLFFRDFDLMATGNLKNLFVVFPLMKTKYYCFHEA